MKTTHSNPHLAKEATRTIQRINITSQWATKTTKTPINSQNTILAVFQTLAVKTSWILINMNPSLLDSKKKYTINIWDRSVTISSSREHKNLAKILNPVSKVWRMLTFTNWRLRMTSIALLVRINWSNLSCLWGKSKNLDFIASWIKIPRCLQNLPKL